MSDNHYPAHRIKSNIRYHALTLIADEEGRIIIEAQTRFAGFDPEDDRFELRILMDIYPDKIASLLEALKEPYQVVNDVRDFMNWYLSGGHAIVAREIIEQFLPSQLEPSRCIQDGSFPGFTSPELLPATAFQRAPSPKLRMKVFDRDKRRCMICGQRPADDTNIVLHTHHIRPFGKGGITTEKNLITLCHTCHVGLDPHDDMSLYSLIKDETAGENGNPADVRQRTLIRGILAYRSVIQKDWVDVEDGRKQKRSRRAKV